MDVYIPADDLADRRPACVVKTEPMILVTGGTGFIGQNLIRRLSLEGHKVRTLIRPAAYSPQLPHGVPVEAAISSMNDPRGLRAALVGVDVVYHLAGVHWDEPAPNLRFTEVEGTRQLLEAAQDAGVGRLVYLSQIGADQLSAYPLLRAKGLAEDLIRHNPIPFTILRSGLVYGAGDHFTTTIAKLLALAPGVLPIPSDGATLVQPLWVEDLVSCLIWSLDLEELLNETLEIGGPEFLSLREVIESVASVAGLHRALLSTRPSYLRILVSTLRYFLPRLPISNYWVDYFAVNRIAELDALTKAFGLLPARMLRHLDHLESVDWRGAALAQLLGSAE